MNFLGIGGSLYRAAQTQWAPSLTVHDPDPPIVLEIPDTGGLKVTAHSPPIVSVDGGIYTVTSARFTPPLNSLLVAVCFSDNTSGTTNDPSPSVTNSGPTAFTWTLGPARNPSEDNGGSAKIYTAKVTASQEIRVTYASGGSGANGRSCKLKVYVVTGQDQTTPTGAVGEGSDTTNNITPNGYTSTRDLSLGIGGAVDWTANGLPTSTDIEHSAHSAGEISALACHKVSTTTPSGSSVTFNFDAAGAAAADWNWIAIEIMPPGVVAEELVNLFLLMGVGR